MRNTPWIPLLLIIMAASALAPAGRAQRGRGRGPSPAIRERLGNYFVDANLANGEDLKARLAGSTLVRDAAGAGHLSLLYLYDPNQDPAKHERFEQALFNVEQVQVALRSFLCGRVNLADHRTTQAELQKKAPLFVIFDAQGKAAATVSMGGFKASASALLSGLSKASKGYAKVNLNVFIKKYRTFLRDLNVIETRKRDLGAKRKRLVSSGSKESKMKKLAREERELSDSETKLMRGEKALLEKAKIPSRPAGARLVGQRNRRR